MEATLNLVNGDVKMSRSNPIITICGLQLTTEDLERIVTKAVDITDNVPMYYNPASARRDLCNIIQDIRNRQGLSKISKGIVGE